MAKKGSGGGRRAGRQAAQGGRADAVWVCRGCCCGTRAEHPGVDHAALERAARDGARRAGADYAVTDCLGPCGQGNIVVVRADGFTRWFRRMLDVGTTERLLDHLAETGTVEGLPEDLERRLMLGRDGRRPDVA